MFRLPDSDSDIFSPGAKKGPRRLHIPGYDFPALLTGSSVWMLWSVLTVIILDVGYPFSIGQLFSLVATSGLSAASVRLISAYLGGVSGRRETVFVILLLLLSALALLLFAFSSLETPYWVFRVAALISGFGAAILPLGESCIPVSTPASRTIREVRTSTADYGLTLVQITVPLFGIIGGINYWSDEHLIFVNNSSYVLGKLNAGSHFGIISALFLPFLLLFWSLIKLFRVKTSGGFHFSEAIRVLVVCCLLALLCFALVELGDIYGSWSVALSGEVGIILALVFVLGLLRILSSVAAGELQKVIINRKVQLLALLYLMGFGSFLGFAVALPLLGKVMFDLQLIGTDQYQSKSVDSGVLMYVWLLPVAGFVTRGIGAWLSHYLRAERINQAALFLMCFSSLMMAYFLTDRDRINVYYYQFYVAAMVFFVGSGLSSGSVFHLILKALPPACINQACLWISSVSAFGVFYISDIFSSRYGSIDPSATIVGFSVFYMIGIILNGYFFIRRKSSFSF